MEPRTPSQSASEMTRWMRPQDANLAGNVHGGVVMRLCDEAAALAAIRHCGGRVVTAAMDRMIFLNPVYVGHLVMFRSSVNAAWRSSMEVGVRVEAEDIITGVITHTSSAYLTMVALDEDGRPMEVPPIVPETDEDNRRHREAEFRRENRLAERGRIVEERGGMRGGTLPGFHAPPSPPAAED